LLKRRKRSEGIRPAAAEWQRTKRSSDGVRDICCYRKESEYLIVKTLAPADDPTFPSLTKKFVPALPVRTPDEQFHGVNQPSPSAPRPWIKHEDCRGAMPLRKTFDASQRLRVLKGEYRWIRARARESMRSPVGPVHAGIIEPGHFRFQADGRGRHQSRGKTGYVHKASKKVRVPLLE